MPDKKTSAPASTRSVEEVKTETVGATSQPVQNENSGAARRDSLGADRLPVDNLRDAVPFLRRPFMPEAIKFKIQTVFREAKGCLVVAYIDARLVIDRLNMVLPDQWSARYEPVEGKPGLMWCHLTLGSVMAAGPFPDHITRSDIGEGQGQTEGMKAKAAVSDSLKRAAVHFGVGVSVYALPQITLWANQEHVEPAKTKDGKPSLKLTEHGHMKLREGYAQWLETKNRFGDPLDHGDVEGAVFDEDEIETEAPAEMPPALTDDLALGQADHARSIYAEISRAGGGKGKRDLAPGTFNARLNANRHNHELMDAFIVWLGQRRDEILKKYGEDA